MAFIIAVVIMALIYGFTVSYYKNHWKNGFIVDVRFDRKGVDAGTECTLTETVENHKRMPLPVVSVDIAADASFEFEDEDYDGSRIGISDKYYRKDVYTLKALRRVKRTLHFRPLRRGYFRISDPNVVTRDYFMANRYAEVFNCETSLFVYPAKFDVSVINDIFRRVSGEYIARKTIEEDPFAFRGIREYRPGDPVRRINWKASAKCEDLLVNTFDSTFSQEVCILLDGRTRYITEKRYILEKSISAASSAAMFILKRGTRVSLKSGFRDPFSDGTLDIEGGVNLQQMGVIDRSLACIDAESDAEDINIYLDRIKDSDEKRPLYFLITSDMDQKRYKKLRDLQEDHFDICGFLIMPDTGNNIRTEIPEGFVRI